jgi:Calcium binding
MRKRRYVKPVLLDRKGTKGRSGPQSGQGPKLSRARLKVLVEQAIVDAYDESEQSMGFFNMIEEYLRVPFLTSVLSMEVTVESIELTEAGEIVAICRKGNIRQKISVLELPLPSSFPEGAEWITAYRHWRRGFV